MRSKFLKKIAQAAYRRTRRSPFTGDLANIRRFIIYVTSLCCVQREIKMAAEFGVEKASDSVETEVADSDNITLKLRLM